MKTKVPTPAANEPSCICIKLRRATRAITRLYDEALNASGLNITQFSLLKSVFTLEPIAFGDLAAANKLDRSTLGRNIRVMVRKKAVEFEPGDDERTRLVRTTALGKKLLNSATPLWIAAQDDVASRISARELVDFLRTLKQLETLATADD